MPTVIVATLLSYVAGWIVGVPVLLPLLNTAAAWVIMVRRLRDGRVMGAIAVMLVWAAVMGVASTTMAAGGWSRAGGRDLFLRADYRGEMLTWVRTGVGPESDPATFVPRHLAHAGVFLTASVASGGLLSMPMGAVLMNSMGDYVGAMARESAHPIASAVLGWHPWAVVRIIAFVILGVLLSAVPLSRLMGFPFTLARYRTWVGAGLGLLALDIGLKWALAPAWGAVLKGLAGW